MAGKPKARYTHPMASLRSLWSWMLPREREHIDRYHIAAVTNPAELRQADCLPLEIQFVLAKRPERQEVMERLLEAGYGLGVRTVNKTPERVLQAVDRISHLTQENTVIPWLPRLLRDGDLPVFTEYELRLAEREGVELYAEAKTILERRYEFKKIILIDLHNRGLGESERELMLEINKDLYPLAVDYIINRVLFDNAHTRTEVAQTIIKALVIIGPIAHVLEHWVSGVGKLFAASADDLLAETAELFALRGSGFSWRQLMKRARILIPVFALATWGAFSVQGFIEAGQISLAGLIYGLSAVALSLTTAFQSISMYKQCYARLRKMAKLPASIQRTDFALALQQDFTNPARLGLFVGALSAPVTAALVFTLIPQHLENGWLLALLGSVESVIAGITVITAAKLNRSRFRRGVRQEIGRLLAAR